MNFNELFQKMRELDAPVAEELKGGQKELDVDKDGDIEADDLKDLRDKKVDEELVDECGDMPMPSGMMGRSTEQQDSISANISMNASGKGGISDLMAILRNIENGGDAHGDHDHERDMAAAIDSMDEPEPLLGMDEAEGGGFDQATTEPNPQTAPMDAAYPTGDDISSHGGNERPKVNGGGNPYAMAAESLIPKLGSLYQEVKLRESNGEQIDEFGVNLTQPRTSWAHKGPAEYDDKANATAMSAKYDAMIKSTEQELAQEKANPRGNPNHIKYLEDQIKGLEKEKMHNMFVAMPDDATNALRKQAIANNELTPGQWLQKATQYFKGKITGKEQPGVEYDRVDTSKQLKPGWKTPTPYKPEAVPMKESNEIIKLSKMLNG